MVTTRMDNDQGWFDEGQCADHGRLDECYPCGCSVTHLHRKYRCETAGSVCDFHQSCSAGLGTSMIPTLTLSMLDRMLAPCGATAEDISRIVGDWHDDGDGWSHETNPHTVQLRDGRDVPYVAEQRND